MREKPSENILNGGDHESFGEREGSKLQTFKADNIDAVGSQRGATSFPAIPKLHMAAANGNEVDVHEQYQEAYDRMRRKERHAKKRKPLKPSRGAVSFHLLYCSTDCYPLK